jgi:uncharacterized cupin superfamily protein
MHITIGDTMTEKTLPVAIVAADAPPRSKPSILPAAFASRFVGREKHPLGDLFALTNFGVNLTRLAPGANSAMRHAHTRQDEFVYILQGNPVLVTDAGETQLAAGMCAGFRAGTGNAHKLLNRSTEEVIFLEVGDRSEGDEVSYPDEDLKATHVDQVWKFMHKDGRPY